MAPATQVRPPQGLVTFHGAGGPLFSIYNINVLLTIVTFGIYYFWGKVKVQSYLLNQTEVDGAPRSVFGHSRSSQVTGPVAFV